MSKSKTKCYFSLTIFYTVAFLLSRIFVTFEGEKKNYKNLTLMTVNTQKVTQKTKKRRKGASDFSYQIM